MTDPIHAEKLFRKLNRELKDHPSIRHRYTLIREFLNQLNGDYARFESYLIQLAEQLPVYSGPVSYSGLDPEIIEQDVRLYNKIAAEIDETGESANFRKALEKLKAVCLIQYICVGELDKAGQLFFEWFGSNPFEGLKIEEGFNSRVLQKVREHLKNYLSGSNSLSHEAHRFIQSILDQTARRLEANDQTVCIPTVEEYRDADGESRMNGRLRKLMVRVEGSEEGGDDKIIRRFPVIGAEQPVWLDSPAVASAARQLFSFRDKRLQGKSFRGDILFENSSAFHDGKSANAGIAFLWFTGIQAYHDIRERYILQPNICITGDVDEQGSILSVAGQGIGSKTEAAFFSGTDYLIVPASQLPRFMEAHDNLRKKYPNRNLEVLGMNNLRELLYDRRLTVYRNPSRITFALQQAWELKFETAGVVTILVLMVVIFRLVYGPMDKVPVIADFEGESLFIKNSTGDIIETLSIDRETVTRATTPYFDYAIDFATIVNNGSSEVIWGDVVRDDQGERKGYLRVKTLGSDEMLWEKELIYDLQFTQKPYVTKNSYRAQKVRVNDFDKDGQAELLKQSNHITYFPGILSLLNPVNGNEISRFINSGHIRDVTVYDIDLDGMDEVIFCGINNAFDMAFLAMLEVDQFDGYSPHTSEYELEDYDIAGMITYVLIPKTLVGLSSESFRPYNIARSITVLEDEQLIKIEVIDFQPNNSIENDLLFRNSHLNFYFNFNFSLVSVGTTDGYDVAANRLFDDREIEYLPDEEYFRKYANKLQYWNGEEFVSSEEYSDMN